MKKLLILLLFPALLYSQEKFEMKTYICRMPVGGIKIDGFLDEESWQKAVPTENFVEMTTGEKMPYVTWAKVLWTRGGLYIGFYVQTENIWGTLTGRDAMMWHDNDVEVFLDTDGDGKDYLELEINALNTAYDVHWDLPLGREGKWDIGFNFEGLKHAVQYKGTLNYNRDKDEYWTVEIFFPWYCFLKYKGDAEIPPKPGDKWIINFYRNEYDDSRTKVSDYIWRPHGGRNMHQPELFGELIFSGDKVE